MRVLQVIAHAQNRCAEKIYKKSSERERRDTRIELFGSIEAEKTAWWSEDERKGCAATPKVLGREDA